MKYKEQIYKVKGPTYFSLYSRARYTLKAELPHKLINPNFSFNLDSKNQDI